MKELILLDLEGTIIKSWYEPELLWKNIHTIMASVNYFRLNPVSQIQYEFGLMSWAVLNRDDLNEFESKYKARIEAAMGITLSPSWILSKNTWLDKSLYETNDKAMILFRLSTSDFVGYNKVILFDDEVIHRQFLSNPIETGASVSILNITQFVKNLEDSF